MNGNILNNIYDKLSQDNLVDVEFDAWQSNFVQDPEVVGNVYNYLSQQGLVTAEPDEWVKNINEELAAQQPEVEEEKEPMTEYETREVVIDALPGKYKIAGYLDNAANIIKDLITKPEEREQTIEVAKNAVKNIKPRLLKTALEIQTGIVDLTTADLDNLGYNEEQRKIRDDAEVFMKEKYKEIQGVEKYLIKDTGEGMVKGIKQGDASDLIGGIINANTSMVETVVPAMLTGGVSLPFQVIAPMYSDYNEAKAKAIYGEDDPDAMDKLIDNDQTELAVPATLGLLATSLEYIGFKSMTKLMFSNPSAMGFGAKLLITSNKEGLTEWGQSGIEAANIAFGEGKDSVEAGKALRDNMFSEVGFESYLNGFVGSSGMTTAGSTVNRALRSDNASIKDVNTKINNLADLNYKKNKTRSKEVKDALDVEIKEAEQDLKNYINEKRKLNKVLTAEEKASLVDVLNKKDSIKGKVESLKTQLKNKEIDNKEFGYAIRSLNNQDKKLSDQLSEIQTAATTRAADVVTETVKEQIKEAGLEGKVTEMTSEDISNIKDEGFDSKTAAKEFGFIKQFADGSFEIILNKDKPMVGTAAHEFMHAVLFKTIGANKNIQDALGDALVEHASGLGGETSILGERLSAYGEFQEDGTFVRADNFGEETITIMSESIIDGSLKFNENFFTKIGDIVRRFSQNYLGKEITFDTGRDVYNFVKDYSKSIKDGKINKAILNVAKEGAKGKLVEGKATPEATVQMSKSAEQKAQAEREVKDIGNTYNVEGGKKAWDEGGSDIAIQEIKEGKYFDDLIAATYKADIVPKDFVGKVYSELTSHIKRFNPEQNDNLFAYINSQVRNKAGNVYNREYKVEEQMKGAKDIDAKTAEGAPVVQIAAESTPDFDVKIETKPTPRSQRARKLKDLSDINLNNTDVISENTYNKLEDIIKRNPDNIEEEITNLIEKDISKEVKKEMGKISKKGKDVVISPEYDSFLSLGFDGIVNSLDANTIKKQYGKLFKIKKKAREKDKKIDPITGKITYPGKGIYDITMPKKAEFIKYFTEGGYTTLLAKQKTLAELVADSYVKKASQKYIANNTKDLNTAIKSELERWIDSREKQKDENKSFDNVLFSKSLRDLSREEEIVFWNNLGEASALMNPALKNLLDYKNVKDILEKVYKGQIKDKNLIAIAKDIVKLLKTYQPAISRNKTIDETKWVEFVADSFMEEANNVVKMLNLEIDGKPVKSAASIYDNIKNIEQGRRVFVDIGNALLKKYGPKKAAKQIAILKGMYANNSKVGRGMFKTDMKTLKVIPVKLKKGENFGSPRNQIFESVPVFNAYVNKIEGKNEAETKAFQEAYKNVKPLFNQDSKSAIKNKDYKGRLKEAQEAREIIDDVMSMLDNDLDIAMFMISNLSSMKTPLRRAANLKYIADNVLNIDPKKVGKLAEYEHMIPANYMALKIIDAYKNKGGIKNLDDFYKNYNVAIIPKTMDNVLKQQGLQSKMLAGYNFDNDPSWTRYYNFLTAGMEGVVSIRDINTNKPIGINFSKSIKNTKTLDAAIRFSRSANNPSKGITVLDFDDTLATTKSLVKYTTPDGKTGTLNAEEYASTYEDLLDQGFTFDFSDFNKVVKGKLAPLFQKALKLQGKFGPENMFVLTARPPQAAKAIFDFLKANGLNISLKNITGLANSTSEAKALWIADKVGEGYNDFYFADDALQNVQAVKNMLDQFDVKSKVQQAKVKFSKDMNTDFNNILEEVTGIEAKKRFSDIKARKRGASKGKFRVFIPPSHEDFVGLLYNFMGKGEKGNQHRDFFEQALVRPLNRAYREIDTARQAIANDYKSLNKQFPDVKNKLTKKTPDGDFTNQDAIRVYLWDKHGYKVPGLSPTDQAKLKELVQSDPDLQAYAETLNIISKQDAYVNPTEGWEGGNIRIDLMDATGRVGRAQYLTEFNENAELLFSEENLNKIEAAYGASFRSALEDMLHRIKTGVNRPKGQSGTVNKFINYLNGSVGSVMFFNTRSAILQQMSNVNYLNFADNNIFAAAKAFANQPQYWKDFAFIFNSDMLKQRRGGIGTDINGAELAEAVSRSTNPVGAVIGKLLKLGFLPTQIGDNIAIATGGATFYRNRVNKYIKDGLNKKEAEAKAFTDFQNITQSTQQSARPDMTSQQQAAWIGKLVLNFLNTPSQYNRIIKKAGSDILNRRITPPNTTQMQSDMSNASRILYYGAAQNLIFYSLQTALFAVMFGLDDEDEEKKAEQILKKKERVINGAIDTILRGSGIYGVAVSTLKNMMIKFLEQRDKGYNKDESAVIMEMLNFSPVIGIKARKVVNAEKTLNYNKNIIDEMNTFDIDNPQWSAVTNYVEATTNAPVNRLYQKSLNLRNAMDNDYTAFQRALFFSGYTTWSLGLDDTKKMKEIKETVKEKKKAASKEKSRIQREEKKKEQEEANKAEIEENKKKSKKDGICSAISGSGERCKRKAIKDGMCTVHEKVKQNKTGKKSQCKKIKNNGKRCGMQTNSASGYCYYHD